MLNQNEEKKMTTKSPEICCTCANWHPFKDTFFDGMCKTKLESSKFDDKCVLWNVCDDVNDQYIAELGYD